jgi:hypothetical protein
MTSITSMRGWSHPGASRNGFGIDPTTEASSSASGTFSAAAPADGFSAVAAATSGSSFPLPCGSGGPVRRREFAASASSSVTSAIGESHVDLGARTFSTLRERGAIPTVTAPSESSSPPRIASALIR